MQDFANNLEQLVARQQAVVPFLRKRNWVERQELLPTVKKLHTKYYTSELVYKKDARGYQYQTQEFAFSQRYRDLVFQAAVACISSRKEFEELFQWHGTQMLYSPLVLDHILPWHVPPWFSSILDRANQWNGAPYPVLMDLIAHNHYQPSTEHLVRALCRVLVKSRWIKRQEFSDYQYEELFRYERTLQEDFWLLFDQPSTIHDRYQATIPEVFGEDSPWEYTIKRLCQEGHVNRLEVLRACLLTSTKNFNQALTGWFFRLLAGLNPTETELLQLQKELLVCLQSDISKPVTSALKYLKTLCKHPDFQRNAFLDTVPQLLQSTTKQVQRTTLMILQQLAKQDKAFRDEVSFYALEALGIDDLPLQQRAAKLILTYAPQPQSELSEQLALYEDTIYSEVATQLQPWLTITTTTEVATADDYPLVTPSVLREANQLPVFTTFDEQLFFVTQVLDNHAPHHAEQFLVVLSALDQQINAKNANKLSPIFKRALDIMWGYSEWSTGINLTLAYYLNDYADHLNRKFPGCLPTRAAYITQRKRDRLNPWRPYQTLVQKQKKEATPCPFVDRFYLEAQRQLFTGHDLPKLSTPTHTPCWLDPMVLLQRLQAWEKAEQPVDLLDWQVALLRLPLHDTVAPKTVDTLWQMKAGPQRAILAYALGLATLPEVKAGDFRLLLPAVIARRDTDGLAQLTAIGGQQLHSFYKDYSWEHHTKVEQYERYDFRKHETKAVVWKNKSLQLNEMVQAQQGLNGLLTKARKKLRQWGATPGADFGVFTHFDFHLHGVYSWYYLNAQDAARLLSFCPNHLPLYLAPIVANVLRTSDIDNTVDKYLLERLLPCLRQVWHKKEEHEVVYLFLAATLLCSHKTARELAAELWLDAIQHNQINTDLLGHCLGRLMGYQYAPLKRFTDLLGQQLYRLSPWHDQQLLQLLNAMLPGMPANPVTNTKKWLTIYGELVQQYGITPTVEGQAKLTQWQAKKSLSKLAKKAISPIIPRL